jgi:hypothetical protein
MLTTIFTSLNGPAFANNLLHKLASFQHAARVIAGAVIIKTTI